MKKIKLHCSTKNEWGHGCTHSIDEIDYGRPGCSCRCHIVPPSPKSLNPEYRKSDVEAILSEYSYLTYKLRNAIRHDIEGTNIPPYKDELKAVENEITDFWRTKLEAYGAGERESGAGEYRQFILNVLEGIDEADREMNNPYGGTKAIRFAIQSRTADSEV